MEIHQALAELTRFIPLESLSERLAMPQLFLSEEVKSIVPSIVLGQDGPVLKSMLLVTENYLCDIRLPGPQVSNDFDIISIRSIRNYRVMAWTHEIMENDTVTASYEIAEIELVHDLGPTGTRTALQYAGQERSEWLSKVREAIPVNLIT